MSFGNSELLAQIKPLEKFAYKLCKNSEDAKDLLQDTLLRALENREKYISGSNMFGWTSKIMFNLFVSGYRRKVKRESKFELTEEILEQIPESANQNYIADIGRVNDAMQSMSQEFRDVLITVAALGMSYDEAAEKLRIPTGTVRSRLNRARIVLNKKMAPIPAAHIITHTPVNPENRMAR